MINATLSAAIATSQRDLLYYSISIQDRADKSIVAACSICLIPHHVRGNITHLGDWMGAQFGCCCSSIRVGDFSLLGVTLSILHKFVSIGGQRHERKLTQAMYLPTFKCGTPSFYLSTQSRFYQSIDDRSFFCQINNSVGEFFRN